MFYVTVRTLLGFLRNQNLRVEFRNYINATASNNWIKFQIVKKFVDYRFPNFQDPTIGI